MKIFWKILFAALFAIAPLAVCAQTSKTHTVQRGETFALVAKRYGLTEQELKNANPDEDVCYAGMKLTIPTQGSASAFSTPKKQCKATVISDKYYISEDYYHFGDSLDAEAKRGNLIAIKELGDCYHWGVDGKTRNLTKALELYNKAAEVDYPFAQWEIAQMYGAGSGVKRDKEKSKEWYDKAFDNFTDYANKGNAKAMTRLADFYVSSSIPGNLGRLDIELGLYWYREAVKSGDYTAAVDLATIYRKGYGVEKDEGEALKWDARFCIDVEKKGLFAEDYSSYGSLKKAGYSKDKWSDVAKDTYKENIKPVKPAPTYTVASTGKASSSSLASSTTDNIQASNTQQKAVTNSGSSNRVCGSDWFEMYIVNCSKCGGNGVVTCQKCGGNGKEQCYNRAFVFGTMFGVQHPMNCALCHNTLWINCRNCFGKGTQMCSICAGQKSIRQIHITKNNPCVHPLPAAGTFPTGTTLSYMTAMVYFKGLRNISRLYFRPDGRVVMGYGMVMFLVDNGESWLLIPEKNFGGTQYLLSKDFKYLFMNEKLSVITSGEQLAAQEKINQQATAFAEMYSNTYLGGNTQKESEIGKQIKQDIADIEAKQAARARQERSDNKLNVTLTQTNREVHCDRCGWGLAHTHYK